MVEVAVVSDTHCYHDVGADVPTWVRERVAAADHVIHAGDFVTGETVEFFREHAGRLTAVRGNSDVSSVDLPEVASLHVAGVTFGVTHPMGVGDASVDSAAYERAVVGTVRETVGENAVAVAGHSHRVIDTLVDGTRLLNPGSATGALPAEEATMLVVNVEAGACDVTAYDADGPRDA